MGIFNFIKKSKSKNGTDILKEKSVFEPNSAEDNQLSIDNNPILREETISKYQLPYSYENFLDNPSNSKYVSMKEMMDSFPQSISDSELIFALGKNKSNLPVYCNIVDLPHLLIGGTTGSGKTTCLNSIILSLLLTKKPDQVKLVLVDPKKVEFSLYKDIPHLLWPVIDDSMMAVNMLKKIVVFIENRYDLFASAGVKNIDIYNEQIGNNCMNHLPRIVIIIDHFSDLMTVTGKDVEQSVRRISELARNAGIHLILSTQRPSSDVLTGTIKSNIPSRISFALPSEIDSKIILDQPGADRLLGNGDMLYYPMGSQVPQRIQGTNVTDSEIRKVVGYVKSQAEPEYEDSYYEFLANSSYLKNNKKDSLYDEVVEFVRVQGKASTSLLQRRFGIGYSRASHLIDALEDNGIIGPANGAKPRDVYIK